MRTLASEENLIAGDLELRPGEFAVLVRGCRLELTVREFQLLSAFIRRPERIVTRQELFAVAWGGRLRAGDRSVDVFVRKLRKKLEHALPDWRFIHTHVGFGYRFSAERSHCFHNGTTDR